MSMSEWILSRLLPSPGSAFRDLVGEIAVSPEPSYAFAELLDLLDPMSAGELELAAAELPDVALDPYWQNYLAATVEQAAAAKGAKVPRWTQDIPPLPAPVFGSSLASLRLHLLVDAPPAFAARNIFIDSALGGRV
jgi:hypothetical protein